MDKKSVINGVNRNHPIPGISVGGIVFNDHSVLLIKRDKPPALGLWSVPGGKLDLGESLVDACKREVMEETGLAIDIGNIAAVVEHRIESFHYVIVDFIVILSDANVNTPIASSDVSEAQWVKINHLSQYNLVKGLEHIIIKTYNAENNGELSGLIDVDGQGQDFI